MGTNYYLRDFEDPDDDPSGWHIGKQSAGWAWCWADPPNDPTISERWAKFAREHPDAVVTDEYGKEHGVLADFVAARSGSEVHHPGKGWC